VRIFCVEEAQMLAPWMIRKLREEEEDQSRRDRESWDRQPRVGVEDRPEAPHRQANTPDHSREGGICEVDFSI